MKTVLKTLGKFYCIAGAIWLTFSILSLGILNRGAKHQVPGVVKELIRTEWDGIREVNALIETQDGKGTVLARLYTAGIETNDEVRVNLSTGGKRHSFIHASVMD